MPNKQIHVGVNGVLHGPYSEILEVCKAVDDSDLEMLGASDSPVLVKELYVTSAYCVLNTSRVKIVSAVTNPVTRHPSITASGVYALDQLGPGRVGLGMATGDSALWGIGVKGIATVAHLREYILTVKGLLHGDEVEYRGRKFSPQWRDWSEPKNIPVYVACSGPKVLRMASQVADGLIMAMGMGDEDLKYIFGIINDACAEVGRNPDELDIWWQTSLVFHSSVEEGMENNLGVNVIWMTMGSIEGKRIPDEYKERLVELTKDQHDFSTSYLHKNLGAWMVQRAKELGLYDWLMTRSARIWGTPDDVSRRVIELADLGATKFLFYGGIAGPDKVGFVKRVAKEVVPKVI